jgi:DNA-binding transcriptional regulator YhcF (GntR family)
MKLSKYKKVAEMVRGQIANGVLPPGASAPSGAALARSTGYSALTCRRALRTLVEDGVLAPGASRNARPRVPSPDRRNGTLADAKRELSAALAGRRRAAGLTQPQLAQITGDSVTAIGHAETGPSVAVPSLLGTRRQSPQRQRRTIAPAWCIPCR